MLSIRLKKLEYKTIEKKIYTWWDPCSSWMMAWQ
jgi:hypothetical protein